MSRPRGSFDAVAPSSYGMNLGTCILCILQYCESHARCPIIDVNHNRSASHQHTPQQIRSHSQHQPLFWNSGGSGSIDQPSYFSQSRAAHPPLHSVSHASQQQQSHGSRASQYTAVSLTAAEYRFSNGHINSTPRHVQGVSDWVGCNKTMSSQ
jgi:hypothetical protein